MSDAPEPDAHPSRTRRWAAGDARGFGVEGLRPAAQPGDAQGAHRDLADIMDVGFACAYLATPYARRLTGRTIYVDGGAQIFG